MKYIVITFIGCVFLFTSCVKDEGNYDYLAPEVPTVAINNVYQVFVGDRLVIEPEVKFSDASLLSYEWTISDPGQMKEYSYEGPKLDIFFGLQAKVYTARLTVTDNQTGMKYFYPFSISGQTAFSEGVVLLTSKNGRAELSFVKPDGTVQENLYEQMHDEPLPMGPIQIVPLQHMSMVGKPYLGYWIICSDKKNPGVEINVNTMGRIKSFKENFFTIPEGDVSAQQFITRDDATMAGIINNKFYVGSFATYYMSPVYGFFGNPIPGDYHLASCLAVAPDKTFVWSYDTVKKSLVCFIPPGGIFFEASSMPGPPPAFDPANVGLDLITLLSFNGGFYLFGRDASGTIQELKFSTGGQMVISNYKRPFISPDLIKEDTKWVLLPGLEVFYFSSGNKIYRYNPLNQSIETLATLDGNVTLLKAGKEAGQLVVGTEGHLYWLNISAGQEGVIQRSINGFTGQPVDIYERKDEV